MIANLKIDIEAEPSYLQNWKYFEAERKYRLAYKLDIYTKVVSHSAVACSLAEMMGMGRAKIKEKRLQKQLSGPTKPPFHPLVLL